jgi:chemotaxis protein MotA
MATSRRFTRPDIGSWLGLLVGIGGIVAGLILEGGHLSEILQPTGAIIVFGGTLGAVLVTNAPRNVTGAFKRLGWIFFQPDYSKEQVLDQVLDYANRARRNGIVSLEQDVEHIDDPFMRKALSLGVDGTDLQEMKQAMHLQMDLEEKRLRQEAKVYESAGGYSPTIGIIGAVLGLIQVMQNIKDLEKVAEGIAVAFVATIYGVGAANLLFLPVANKLRIRAAELINLREMMLEGACSIVQGQHPTIIQRKLEAYLDEGSAIKQREVTAPRRTVRRAA